MNCPECGAETKRMVPRYDADAIAFEEILIEQHYVIQPEDAFFSDAYSFGEGAVAVLSENMPRLKRDVWITKDRNHMWWDEPEWEDWCGVHGEVYEKASAVVQEREAE